jgi:feruloyl esterase
VSTKRLLATGFGFAFACAVATSAVVVSGFGRTAGASVLKGTQSAGVSEPTLVRRFAQSRAGSSAPTPASCETLASRALPNTTITSAQAMPSGTFTPPGASPAAKPNAALRDLPAFCRVAATLKPWADSDIRIEVWLPAGSWNGKFQAVGNGGWAGSINYASMAEALKRGYATSSTDGGHAGGGGPWMQSPEKLIDFGYRAVHEMALRGKELASAYYGSAPRLSYFNGCSGGGRQGLMEAERFPDDFDGIVAGAPAVNTTGRAAFAMWIAQAMHEDEAAYIPPAKYAAIHDAVLNACDAADGVKDGVLENPKQCRFDPKVLQCTSGDSPACLTAPQVESARKTYAQLLNPRTQEEISPGLLPGSELGWATYGSSQPFALGLQMYQHMVFKDPKWDYRTLDFDRDVALTRKIENGVIDVTDGKLEAFFKRRGKIIHYHGWSDPQITPLSSVKYYERVRAAAGAAVNDSYRLFMVPGMAHCGGGDGTSTFDMVAALEEWVEKGKAPDQIPASRTRNGAIDRTRPLCPYPQVAKYTGTGSTEEARNFVCGN